MRSMRSDFVLDIDLSELDEWEIDLIRTAEKFKRGRHAKYFLRNAGNKLQRRTLNAAKQSVTKRTGNLFKGIRRGRVYKYGGRDGNFAVRVFGGKPAHHAHLVNYGHRIVIKGVDTGKRTRAFKFFEKGAIEYAPQWDKDVRNYVDTLLKEGDIY